MATSEDEDNTNTNEGSHSPFTETQRHQELVPPFKLSHIPSQVTSTEIPPRDITAKFRSAAAALQTGRLIKDAYFTLFEAVGALEIMDPKMDSGYIAAGESLENDYDVLRDHLPEEIVGIMDQLMGFEMAWHMGHPLSQSLFTSYYIDRLLWPEATTLDEACFERDKTLLKENPLLTLVLRAYCLALIKTCYFVHHTIVSNLFYEEEDFVSNLYHRKLFPEVEVVKVEQVLDEALTYLNQPYALETTDLKDALISRIEFRKSFLTAVRLESAIHSSDTTDAWNQCLRILPLLYKTNAVGLSVSDAFSTKIQCKLASGVPPRPIIEIGFEESYTYLHRLCQKGHELFLIRGLNDGSNLMNYIWTSHLRTPHPCVYIRCLLQSLIENNTRDPERRSMPELVLDNLREIVLPASWLLDPGNNDVEAPYDPRYQVVKKLEPFLSRAQESCLDLFRALCMNPSRVRRMLCHLVHGWDNLQLDAEHLDMELRTYTKEVPLEDDSVLGGQIWAFPFSSWAYYHKLQQMQWIVQLGFELNIYRVEELAGMYWYLHHLANTRSRHLERIRRFTTRSFHLKPRPNSSESAAFRRSFSFIGFAILEASATQSFADGLSYFFSFLSYAGIIPSTDCLRPYGTPSLRYTLRMRPFLPLSLPEVPSYSEFTSLVSLRTTEPRRRQGLSETEDSKEQAFLILDAADQALTLARKEWDAVSKTKPDVARTLGCEDRWKSSVRDVVRACIAGSIAVATAKKLLMVSGDREIHKTLKAEFPLPEKRYHPWWVVPSVSEINYP